MQINAALVKELRERTGLGMMECKKALQETGGDMEAAIESLRKKAGSKVEKKAGRTAAEGIIGLFIAPDRKVAAIAEVNSETDFVARQEDFMEFAAAAARRAASDNPSSLDELNALPLVDSGAASIAQTREGLVAKLGENINLRRFARYETSSGHIGSYVHNGKIGVLVEMEGGNEALARDIAMHVAASQPEYVSRDDVPAEIAAKEKEIFSAQAAATGKPPEIIEKMVSGRVNKALSEITLLGQPFVKDPDTSVEKLLKSAGARVARFVRYQVGEGIEKDTTDFATEVMAQARGA